MENTFFHSHSFEEPGIYFFRYSYKNSVVILPLQIQSFADSPFRAAP
jgi:hypothetical protein